ncbi:MAG: hypothetical protein WBN22_15030 [Verrucomicrobiia bacterium]
MKNREVFLNDPLGWTLVNEGVSSNNNLDPETVRYELKTFVCDGEYRNGLVSILRGYLSNFSKPEQKAAWISGFYGSGKSHLAKVLRYLWTDYKFADGVSARSLAKLPTDVTDLLKELSTLGTSHGGLHSVGGTLKAGSGSVRLRLLGMIFQSVGLHESYQFSKFILDLRRDGKETAFREHLQAAGVNADKEIKRLYTSKSVAEAYLKCYPHLGTVANVGPALLASYHQDEDKDISIPEMLATIRETLGKKGKLPCTLIVLDEVQQFINQNNDLASDIQEVTEACSKQLDSRVMFLGTGQSALSDTQQLQKLLGRYVIKCHLRDNDVENVVRTVVLQKKESAKPAIKDLVAKHEGEITRQLKTTKIGVQTEDHEAYIPDYPLLPVRLRFWERVLHSVDPTGTTAQMRTQLRVAHEACRACRTLGRNSPRCIMIVGGCWIAPCCAPWRKFAMPMTLRPSAWPFGQFICPGWSSAPSMSKSVLPNTRTRTVLPLAHSPLNLELFISLWMVCATTSPAAWPWPLRIWVLPSPNLTNGPHCPVLPPPANPPGYHWPNSLMRPQSAMVLKPQKKIQAKR